jgi:hypothetical protein
MSMRCLLLPRAPFAHQLPILVPRKITSPPPFNIILIPSEVVKFDPHTLTTRNSIRYLESYRATTYVHIRAAMSGPIKCSILGAGEHSS